MVTLDRHTAVSKPLQSRAILTLRSAQLLSLLVVLSGYVFNLPRFFDFRIERVPLYEFQRQTGCGLYSVNSTSSSSPSSFSIVFSPSSEHNESLWRQLERPVAIQTPNWRAKQFYATVYHMVCMLLFVQFGPSRCFCSTTHCSSGACAKVVYGGRRCSAMKAARWGDQPLVHWATRKSKNTSQRSRTKPVKNSTSTIHTYFGVHRSFQCA